MWEVTTDVFINYAPTSLVKYDKVKLGNVYKPIEAIEKYCEKLKEGGVSDMTDRMTWIEKIEKNKDCPMCKAYLKHLSSWDDDIGKLQKDIRILKEALSLVNEHAETCAIFIRDNRCCTCFYEKIKKINKEDE